MKRIFCIILALCLCLSLFAGCGETSVSEVPTPTPEASPEVTPEAMPEPMAKGFSFTRENMPRMDGSTSLVPLAQAAASLLLGESREAVEDLVQFNRTSQSYRNLMGDWCDILIASVPSADVYEEMDNNNFLYEMEPIATDALIFVVNEGNPVDSLTTEQIIGIYTGEITNWSEVGGLDEPIAAFQRNSGAGSQALMEKLVMGDTPMMTPPTELMAGSMGELMEYVRSYDNSAGAIGYSVYYYASDMRMAEGLKIIAVDEVEPTDENIRDGLYPHLSNYYTVIGADEAPDSPARVMFEWLQSAAGQQLVQSEGYVPVKAYEDFESSVTAGGFVVETHPEALTVVNTPEARYSRMSTERIEALAPSGDYGTLHPFVGNMNYDEWGNSNPVYGLFDSQSRIVCDPVYSEVSRLAYWEGAQVEYAPVLLLGRSVDDGSGKAKMLYSFATLDGSFVSPEYGTVRGCDFGVICSEYYSDQNFVIYDFEGNVLMRGSDIKLDGLKFETIYEAQDGYMLAWLTGGEGSKAYLIDPDGNIVAGGWESASFAGEGRLTAILSFDYNSEGLMDFAGNWVIEPEYRNINHHGPCYVTSDTKEVFDRDGKLICDLADDAQEVGLGFIDGEGYHFFDGSVLPLEGEWHSFNFVACPIIYKQEGNTLTLMNTQSGETLSIEGAEQSPYMSQLMVNYVTGPYSGLQYIMVWNGETEYSCELISWDLHTRFAPDGAAPSMGSYSTVVDGFTGEEYIRVNDADFNSYLYSAELELIASPGEWTGVWNGCLVNTDESFCTYTDMDGRVLFRYPLMIDGD